jgi:outer membrane biosynthesis protein TonB
MYRVTLHADGRLSNAHVVGGVRNTAFDEAIVGALTKADSERLLPPLADSSLFDHDTLDLHLTLTPGFIVNVHSTAHSPDTPGVTPLFRLRLPVLAIKRQAAQIPGHGAPLYPKSMRDQHITGEVRAEFVVRADSSVDPGSIQILRSPSMEFVRAVAEWLPRARFYPMEISGCLVASLVQMPLYFDMQ